MSSPTDTPNKSSADFLIHLHETEGIFKAVFNSTFQQIWILGPNGYLLQANKTALDFVKAKYTEIIGVVFWQTPWWKHTSTTQHKLKTAIMKAQKGQLVRLELESQNSKGELCTIDLSIKPIFDNVGNIIYLIAEGRDITQRTKLDDLRKEFLSSAAHELKTPITVIKLLIQAHIAKAKQTGDNSPPLNELELIDRELTRLTELINDILDSARLETGRLSLQFEVVDLRELIEATIKKIRLFAKDHIFYIEKLPHELLIIADAKRLEQVLINLLSNATKYSAKNTNITIGAKKQSGMVIVSVHDEGLGIPKDKQKLIFDRYYQVKSKNSSGFGLGLYISQQIIRRHKGKLWVKSVKGEGSTFYFSLPLYKEKKNKV